MIPATKISASDDLAAQRAYVQKMAGARLSLVAAEAFVRGIRHLGYKHTGTALDEFIDNSIQAGAENVHVVFGYGETSDAKPDRIAVIDDGHGMDPAMLPLATMWGGGHRETPVPQGRQGMGRFGFGLPSAAVSQGQRFTVYSTTKDTTLHQVTLDIEDLGRGRYTDTDGQVRPPEPEPARLPEWLPAYMKDHVPGYGSPGEVFEHGTVVALENLDSLTWVTRSALQRNLLQHFGVAYRNFLREINILVNGERVEPTDPLFTTPGFRFYDLDEDRATPLEPIVINVKDRSERKNLGTIYVRLARLPWTFARQGKDATGQGRLNARNEVLKDHNGFIFVREGRQIDVVTKNPWFAFQNNDRFWKVEVNFPAGLDEEFSVTTSKQQIVPSERLWKILEQAGVKRAIDQIKKDLDQDRAKFEAGGERKGRKRASEEVMEETQTRKPRSVRRGEEANRRLEQEVQKRARETGRQANEVKRELEAEIEGQPYKITEEQMPGAPFFRVEQIGGQVVLALNTAHRFYTDVYAGPDGTPRLRAALELVLFVIGECKLETTEERQEFYSEEIQAWSTLLTTKLGELSRRLNIEDILAVKSAREEEAQYLVGAPAD